MQFVVLSMFVLCSSVATAVAADNWSLICQQCVRSLLRCGQSAQGRPTAIESCSDDYRVCLHDSACLVGNPDAPVAIMTHGHWTPGGNPQVDTAIGGAQENRVRIIWGGTDTVLELRPPAPQPGERFGASLATGDFDGDGRQDLAVGAPGRDGGTGRVYVFSLAQVLREQPPTIIDQTAPAPVGMLEAGDECGYALAAADFTLDGVDDLAISCPGEEGAGGPADHGWAYVYAGQRGESLTFRLHQHLDPGGATMSMPSSSFGAYMRVEDIDLNGDPDLVIGAPGSHPGTRGAVWFRNDLGQLTADGWHTAR